LKLGAAAGATLLVDGRRGLSALQTQGKLITKPVPTTGEQLPVIGLGSAGTFSITPQSTAWGEAQEVLKLFHSLGGKVIDTAPSYGRAESFIGETIQQFGFGNDVFIATKVNVLSAGKDAALRQMQNSLDVFGRKTIDLIQVWNLGGSIAQLSAATLTEHLDALREWKAAGKVRYLGITTSRDPQYDDVEAAMRKYPLDFVQLDYSIGDRVPEERLLPLAREKKIAIIVNRPFTTGNLFGRVAGKSLPPWASEFDCTSWAQYFLKFVVSHPAVTVAVPATNDPKHLRDNMGACFGRLPDEAMRRRMVEYFSSL
jgi:diketogulonate reductase-like aldo/keto reductase